MKTLAPAKQTSSARRQTTVSLCFTAVGVALLTICAWISVPFFSIPFTLQTFALFFLIGLLGTKWSLVAVLCYILLGAIGVPVFSGFGGGVAALAGPTGGYILGFVLVCLVSGPLLSLAKDNPVWQCLAMLAGLVICYALGTLWFAFVSGNFTWQGVASALLTCVVPFVAVDVIKILLSVFALRRLRPLLAKTQLRN